jgi:predicted nuclease of restriction endonuclease-like (RecB) superfamily
MKPVNNNNFYKEIKRILEEARQSAYRAVNVAMVIAYWQIGKRIVEEEQQGNKRAGYGLSLLKDLSKQLSEDFGKGYSVQSLENFRKFYLAFPPIEISSAVQRKSIKDKKSSALRRKLPAAPPFGKTLAFQPQLSWTHYKLLMRIENKTARKFYLQEAVDQNWSTRALERQINSLYYQRILSSKKKTAVIKEAKENTQALAPSAEDFIKDPYVLEFLNLPSNTAFLEKDLENALIQKLQHFLLELGKGFSFVAQQKHIAADDDHFYIDLVFYNYILKCFVLIDLKLGKLSHQDIGQMDLYVRWYEENVKTATDNPTIGIILCSEKNETVVKYSILKGSKQLFASKYKLYLPTEKELAGQVAEELLHYKITHKK